jgi:acid phosphatase
VEKVLVFIVENHSLDQMRADMPFTYGQATQYGYADHYQAITHPSLPNYLAITGGSTYGVTNDDGPTVNGTHETSVFQQALDHGRTAKTYAEGQPAPCTTQNSGRYAVRHNPWAYHLDERTACAAHDVGLDALAGDTRAGDLPDVGLVIPDLCNDAHDCSLATADTWLKTQVSAVEQGPDFTSGHLAVVITADEDDHHQDNTVLTVVAHPALHGTVVSAPLTHYSLSHSLSAVAGAAPMAEAAQAPDLLQAFGLTTAS